MYLRGPNEEKTAGNDLRDRNGHSRCVKCGVDAVHRDRVEWVSGITTDVYYDGETSRGACSVDRFRINEMWNLVREVDAIDENIHC